MTVEERIRNRPSRFDRRYNIGVPTARVRKYYIEHKLKKGDLKKIDVKKWVDETKDLSLSHIRELIISVIILDHDFDETLKHLKSLKHITSSTGDSSTPSIGFGTPPDEEDDDDYYDEEEDYYPNH